VCCIFTPTSPSFHLEAHSVVRIATGWEVRGSNSGTTNRNFSTTTRQSLRPTQPSIRVFTRVIKRPRVRMSGALLFLPPYAFMASTVTFTVTLPTSMDLLTIVTTNSHKLSTRKYKFRLPSYQHLFTAVSNYSLSAPAFRIQRYISSCV
jgi:hypothetical protein